MWPKLIGSRAHVPQFFATVNNFLKFFGAFFGAILIGSRVRDTLIFSICQHFFKLF